MHKRYVERLSTLRTLLKNITYKYFNVYSLICFLTCKTVLSGILVSLFIPTHRVDSYLWALQFLTALVSLSFYVYFQVYGHLLIKI